MVHRRNLLAVATILLVGYSAGCTSLTTPPATGSAPAPGDTITGVIEDVSPGARLVVLAEPVEGYEVVVLTEESEVLALDGSEIAIKELRVGMTIEVSGRSGGSGAMVVTQLRVIEAEAPAPTVTSAAGAQDIVLESPQNGDTISSPVEVRGTVTMTPFEGTLRVRIYDAQGRIVGEGPVTADGEIGRLGTFSAQIAFDAPSGGPGKVEVAETSAEDGSVIASAAVDVTLLGPRGITITGVVTSVFASAQVIMLAEPVEGFTYVAVTGETKITLAEGGEAVLQDVQRGATIQATGEPGGADTLMAEQIVVFQAGTPGSTVAPTVPPSEIVLESPQEGDTVPSPVELRGRISVTPFEGTLVGRVYDAQDQVVGEAPFTVDGEMGQPGTFTAYVSYTTPSVAPGRVEVVDVSARDGSTIASASVAVKLVGPPERTIVGTVDEVLPSARLIVLATLVDGISVVALTDDTELVTADGGTATLLDIRPGMDIQVSGQPGPAETLIASTVHILEADAQEILLEAPEEGATVSSPVEIRGTTSVMPFEGTLNARIYDAQGQVVGEMPFTVGGEVGGPGTFTTWVVHDAASGGPGRVEVVEFSAEDGSILASASVEVVLGSGTSEVTIIGIVSEVFRNARVIVFTEPVNGIELVAVDGQTKILSADGIDVGLEEIEPGMRILVSGQPGGGVTLMASQVRIIVAGPG